MTGESLLGSSYVWDAARGEFISAMHKRIAEILTDYDPDLRLVYIPPTDRRAADDTMTYVVGYVRLGQAPQIVMYLRDDEINETLLARIWMNDTRRNDPLAYLEKLEAARAAIKFKEDLDKSGDSMDRAKSMIASPMHTISLGGGRKLIT